jgi:type II secretory ATPase GspE/PulE/Tfp pilus assembly ATPase PilB-like protein
MQGYKGRMGIYELLLVTEELRTPILARSPSSTISQIAIEQGMRLLRVDGWEKVKEGLTTVEEVLRVTQIEQHLDNFEESIPG